MNNLWVALGLVLVLEGTVYALFPEKMIEMMRRIPDSPPAILRAMGMVAVAIGWLVVWLARRQT